MNIARIETTLVTEIKNSDFNNHPPSSISQITLISEPIDDIHVVTKSYVDSLSEMDKIERHVSLVYDDQKNESDNNNLTNLDSILVNRNPSADKELVNRSYVDDPLGDGTFVRFNQKLGNSQGDYPRLSL